MDPKEGISTIKLTSEATAELVDRARALHEGERKQAGGEEQGVLCHAETRGILDQLPKSQKRSSFLEWFFEQQGCVQEGDQFPQAHAFFSTLTPERKDLLLILQKIRRKNEQGSRSNLHRWPMVQLFPDFKSASEKNASAITNREFYVTIDPQYASSFVEIDKSRQETGNMRVHGIFSFKNISALAIPPIIVDGLEFFDCLHLTELPEGLDIRLSLKIQSCLGLQKISSPKFEGDRNSDRSVFMLNDCPSLHVIPSSIQAHGILMENLPGVEEIGELNGVNISIYNCKSLKTISAINPDFQSLNLRGVGSLVLSPEACASIRQRIEKNGGCLINLDDALWEQVYAESVPEGDGLQPSLVAMKKRTTGQMPAIQFTDYLKEVPVQEVGRDANQKMPEVVPERFGLLEMQSAAEQLVQKLHHCCDQQVAELLHGQRPEMDKPLEVQVLMPFSDAIKRLIDVLADVNLETLLSDELSRRYVEISGSLGQVAACIRSLKSEFFGEASETELTRVIRDADITGKFNAALDLNKASLPFLVQCAQGYVKQGFPQGEDTKIFARIFELLGIEAPPDDDRRGMEIFLHILSKVLNKQTDLRDFRRRILELNAIQEGARFAIVDNTAKVAADLIPGKSLFAMTARLFRLLASKLFGKEGEKNAPSDATAELSVKPPLRKSLGVRLKRFFLGSDWDEVERDIK